MPWWQVLLILSIVVVALGLISSLRVAMEKRKGEVLDEGVSGTVSKHKMKANPILWTYVIFIILIFFVAVYFLIKYPGVRIPGG